MPKQVVVLDESHSLRTTDRAPDAPHTEAAAAAVRAAARAVLLSGTPSLTRPFDLFRQVRGMHCVDRVFAAGVDAFNWIWRLWET